MSQPLKQPYRVRLHDEDLARLKKEAEKQGCKPHKVAVKAIRAYLDAQAS